MDSAPEPGIAQRADATAFLDHENQDATRQHEVIASVLWPALRDLGVTGGRLLVLGEDPEVYAGLPATDRRLPHGTTAELTATVPGRPWPHTGLHLRRHTSDTEEDQFDVVITNVPVNDVVLHDPEAGEARRQIQIVHALGSIALAREGGIIAVLAASELLDDPDSLPRQLMSQGTDLLGAVRLPAGALRRAPGNDLPVDLLLLRRNDSDTPRTVAFTEAVPVTLDGRTVHLNQYYDTHPDHVLGTLTSQDNPWGPPTTTVLPDPGALATQLTNTLRDITTTAHARGLTPWTGNTPLDVAAPIDHRLPAPREHTGYGPTEIPVKDLNEARRVVARLRTQRRSTRTARADPDHRDPGPTPDPDRPAL